MIRMQTISGAYDEVSNNTLKLIKVPLAHTQIIYINKITKDPLCM